jgi:hypothetical protein
VVEAEDAGWWPLNQDQPGQDEEGEGEGHKKQEDREGEINPFVGALNANYGAHIQKACHGQVQCGLSD